MEVDVSFTFDSLAPRNASFLNKVKIKYKTKGVVSCGIRKCGKLKLQNDKRRWGCVVLWVPNVDVRRMSGEERKW